MNIIPGKKTYITAALMLAIAAGKLLGIEVPGFEGGDAGTLIAAAFGLIFGRAGAKADASK